MKIALTLATLAYAVVYPVTDSVAFGEPEI